MPKVGKKKFPYTKAGKKAAEDEEEEMKKKGKGKKRPFVPFGKKKK